ncbi:beta-N-acetylhexosaminidase [candidate division KSB1 bacterium]|nr:beta-N-acetylhexosaminidase [candidate division KSB1 bacterium]
MKTIPDIKSLTLEQKIGQMFLFGFSGREPSQEFQELVTKNHTGNIIVFSRNFPDAHHLRSLCQSFYEEMTIPPLIAIDQEGGIVTRITKGATLMPGNMALAATGEPSLARRCGEIIGRELRAIGVNLNLAPVLDINKPENPGVGVRSFGETPEVVTQYGVEFINGLKSQHVFSTAKHFPGLGSAVRDTHFDMSIIDKSKNELERFDIAPFRSAIEIGVDCIMTTHAGYTAYKTDNNVLPATFTPGITGNLLRKKLGFSGVVITDDLEMGAAIKSFDMRNAVVTAIKAGADLLSVCHDIDSQKRAISSVFEAVETGSLSESRIDKSVERIFDLKKKFLENYDKFFEEDVGDLIDQHKETTKEIVRNSITVTDPERAIPLSLIPNEKLLVIVPQFRQLTPVEEHGEAMEQTGKLLIHTIKKHHSNVQKSVFNTSPSREEIDRILADVMSADKVILCSHNAHLDKNQAKLVMKVGNSAKPVILMTLRNPYDKLISPEIKTIIDIYVPHPRSIEEGIARLFRI